MISPIIKSPSKVLPPVSSVVIWLPSTMYLPLASSAGPPTLLLSSQPVVALPRSKATRGGTGVTVRLPLSTTTRASLYISLALSQLAMAHRQTHHQRNRGQLLFRARRPDLYLSSSSAS